MSACARALAATLAAAALAACTTVDPDAGFPAVAGTVQERAGLEPAWLRGVPDPEVAQRVDQLLADGLGADEAVAIALVHNRALQSSYADLGIAQAEWVQAGLLHNPVLELASGFGGGPVDLLFGLALDVVDLLYLPRRKRAAAADFEEARLLAAGRVLDLAWSTRNAYTEHQADAQMLEMRQQIADATAASHAVAERMRQAGNVRGLDVAHERALAEQARLDLRDAELRALQSRERLHALMGLWGAQTTWELASVRLPDPPAEPPDAAGLESRAVERSLDLAAAERHVVAAAENLGLTRASALFPEITVRGEAERDGGDWDAGPGLAIPLPLFDRGQARVRRGEMEWLRARDLHHALAVRVRSALRAARDRVVGERERALYLRRVQLPLRERIVQESQLHYNAMQLGIFELLRAREEQIRTGVAYVETLRDYWLARSDLDLLLAGRLPPPEQDLTPAPPLDDLPRFPFPALQ